MSINYIEVVMADQSGSQASSAADLEVSQYSRDRDKYCPHCKHVVPNTTYYRHRRQFYNEEQRVWSNVRLRKPNSMKLIRNNQPDLQDSFVGADESSMIDHAEQTMDQEMHEFTSIPEGLLNSMLFA